MEGNNKEREMRGYYYNHHIEGGTHSSILYPSAVPVKRKRGRPRKYGTPQLTPLPSNILINTTSSSSSTSSFSLGSLSNQWGDAAQGFTPHLISVAPGEDVVQKIMYFYMQQSRREMFILSASGSISNASLLHPATVGGGNITYEGRFEIISLTGSYVHNEVGALTAALTLCLSNTDGQIIGGGVGGPLKAAGPVKVIVGTFFIDTKKDTGAGVKGNASATKLPSPVGELMSSLSSHQTVDSSGGNPIGGNDEPQAIGGSHFMVQQLGLHVTH